MQYLKKLITPTGRAALIALVVSILAVARIFGIGLPEVTEGAISKMLDSLGIFIAVLIGGSALHKAPPPTVLLLALMPALIGCSSFGHWKDPTLEELTDAFCMRQAQAHEAELKVRAQKRGIPLAELLAAFQAACLMRMQNSAERAGMAGVKAKLEEHDNQAAD
jgi:hypothetical protein